MSTIMHDSAISPTAVKAERRPGWGDPALCPSWCESKGLDDGASHDGPSWPRVKTMGHNSYGVTIGAGLDRSTMDGEGFVISIDEDGARLTPKQARKVAQRLIEAAAWVEAHRKV